jgi:hypothetical protein
MGHTDNGIVILAGFGRPDSCFPGKLPEFSWSRKVAMMHYKHQLAAIGPDRVNYIMSEPLG